MGQEVADYRCMRVPVGRVAQPEDIAHGTLFLTRDPARLVTWQTIFVYGGLLTIPEG